MFAFIFEMTKKVGEKTCFYTKGADFNCFFEKKINKQDKKS